MNKRIIFSLLIVFLLTMSVAPTAAQTAPVSVVQASDGTLYVVQGNSAWRLVPDQISDSDLAALSQTGEIDGTLPQSLLTVVEPAPPAPPPPPAPQPAPPPQPAPAPAPPSPAGGTPQLTILTPTEGQSVSAKGGNTFTITGHAVDPVAGAGAIDSVDIWIFGERDAGGATHLGTATPDSQGDWSLSFQPTHFASTHTNIYVYAHSKASGQETEAIRGFNIVG
jgi:hypothetical protein